MSTPNLFTPLALRGMTLSGRLMRSATSENGSDAEGNVRDALRDLYVELARGGTPLIVTGYAYVRPDGWSGLGQNAIHSDALVQQWACVNDAVHRANPDCRIAMQIVHGGRQCRPESVPDPVAPSAIPDPRSGVTPRELSEPQIVELIEAFGQAARRVQQAGFDAVQLHAAHGFLISEFNSPHTNRRTDAWGGTPEKRMRFLREVLARTRRAVGDDFPIFVKLNADDCLPGGLTPQDAADICRTLIHDGIDGIELSAWMAEADPALSPSRPLDPAPDTEGYFLEPCLQVRRQVPAGVPLGLCGGWRSLDRMNSALRDHGFDFVAASRPFVAEPDFFRRLRAGQTRAACTSCNECAAGREPILHCPPARDGRLATPAPPKHQ